MIINIGSLLICVPLWSLLSHIRFLSFHLIIVFIQAMTEKIEKLELHLDLKDKVH